MTAGRGSASAVLCWAAAAATCATASSSCAVVGADCCMPSSAPRMTLITTVQANDTPATAAAGRRHRGTAHTHLMLASYSQRVGPPVTVLQLV